VTVEAQTVGAIGRGILALIGVRRGDDALSADRLLERLLTYRIFPDEQGKMNLSLRDIQGELLLVPNSRSPPTLIKEPGPASVQPPHRMRRGACSTISWRAQGLLMPLWRRAYSGQYASVASQ